MNIPFSQKVAILKYDVIFFKDQCDKYCEIKVFKVYS